MEKPRIEIDKYAVRFIYPEGQTNLFWTELFHPRPNQNFQRDVMYELKKLYEECVRQNIEPEEKEDDRAEEDS